MNSEKNLKKKNNINGAANKANSNGMNNVNHKNNAAQNKKENPASDY